MKICNHATLEMLQNLMEEFKSAYARKDAIKFHISADDVSPAELFGGTWQKVEGRFLLGASSGYAAGSTGGAATHTLLEKEMPIHKHLLFGGDEGTTEFTYEGYEGAMANHNANSNSSYTIAPTKKLSWRGGSSSVGGSLPHNNMPPYLAVNIWKRVA